jgi:3'-phosphoadenosine 5'-phosphosulfate sulfotransferase (PAPS reductase)/FAD synthetase
MAVLLLLREQLDQITVYYVQADRQFPETQAAVAWAKTIAPHFVTLHSQRPTNTVPSDVVPVHAMPFGRMLERAGGPQIIDRYTCCFVTLMQPMQERMIQDGIERIIRGQKQTDPLASSVRDGDVVEGILYHFPLETWTDAEVFYFLQNEGAPVPEYYQYTKGGLDCPGCSAWLEEGRLSYLEMRHPAEHKEAVDNLQYIVGELQAPLTRMQEVLIHGA